MLTSRIRHVMAAALVAILVAAGSPAGAQEKSRLDIVLERGKLIVVTLTTVPPFAFNDDKGQLVGFDIDIARLVATALFKDPNKVEFVSVSAEGRWPAIESGRADMGVGGTTTYPDRAIRVGFTRPFIDSGISVLVGKKSGIKSLKDLDQDKYTIANLNNPQMADRAKRFFPRTQILSFDTPSALFLAV
jgi:polar amino acid transport system substrate-binding protein